MTDEELEKRVEELEQRLDEVQHMKDGEKTQGIHQYDADPAEGRR